MPNYFFRATSIVLSVIKKGSLFFIIFWLSSSVGCKNSTQNSKVKSDSVNVPKIMDTSKLAAYSKTSNLYVLYLTSGELASIFPRFGDTNKVHFISFEPIYTSDGRISLAAFAGRKIGEASNYEEAAAPPVILHVTTVSMFDMTNKDVLLSGQEVNRRNVQHGNQNDLKILREMKNNSSCKYIIFVPTVFLYPGTSSLYEITYGIGCSETIPISKMPDFLTPISTNPTPPRNSYSNR